MSLSFVSPARFAGLGLFSLLLALAGSPAWGAGKGTVGPNAVPTISVDDVTISEGDSGAKTAVFTVSLSAPSAVDVNFLVGTAEVSAIGNDDFQHYYSSPYSIPAGQTTYTLNLVIFGDRAVETDETFQVLLENVSNATVVKGVGIGTIVNDDAGVEPTLLIGNQWTVEGNSGTKTANFTVQLSQPAATDVSFSVATANGTASSGSDYTALNLSNQVIPAGQLKKNIAVTIAGDTSLEKDETFLVNLSNATGATIGRSQAVGTIGNDDSVSAVKIAVGDAFTQEGNSGTKTVTIYVSLSQPAASTVSFDVRTEDSSATAGSDYVAKTLTSQTITAGQTNKTFTVTVNGDTTPEDEERFVLTLANVSTNASVQYSDPHGVVTIPNDDALLSIGDASVLEGIAGTTPMGFPVTLSAPVDNVVEFYVVTCDGTATAGGSDYNAQSGLFVTQINPGVTSKMVYVEVEGDLVLEDDETFCVDLTQVGGVAVADSHAIGTIINDDVPPPTVSVGDASVLEGDLYFSSLRFPITLSHGTMDTVALSYHTESCGGNATPDVSVPYTPGDYSPNSGQEFTFGQGQTSANIAVSVRSDINFEPDETFCLKIDSVRNGVLGDDTGIGTIINDDVLPTISVADASAYESLTGINRTMSFVVSLSKPSPVPVTFDLFTDYGTAKPDLDFISKSAEGLSIPAGLTLLTFDVLVKGDDEVEPNETFTLNMRNAAGAQIVRSQALGTIINDDTAWLSISPATFVEGDDGATTARFAITLSRPLTDAVKFDVGTYSGGTANPGIDYIARSQANRAIDPGRTQAVFEVTIIGDKDPEGDEYFYLGVGNVRGAFSTGMQIMATIQDDDAPALTAISAIQGASKASALQGKAVATEGVVTALTDLGFYLQSADGQQDGDAATAEALFVAGASEMPAVGDRVRVDGRVREWAAGRAPGQSTQTQIVASSVLVLGHDQPLPGPIALRDAGRAVAAPAVAGFERFEGMRVAISPLTVTAASGGSVDEQSGQVRGDGRFYSAARASDGVARRLRILSAGQRGAPVLSVDAGDVLTGVVGVLADGDGGFELLPDPSAAIGITSGATPLPVSRASTSQATVGSFNLRRFFDSSRQGSEPVLAPDAYATRLAKTANAICVYAGSPAILGLQEVENAQVLGDLAAAVNSRAGNVLFPDACKRDPAYVALRDGSRPGSRLGLLVSTAPVRPGLPRVEVRSLASQAGTETFAWRDGGREPLFESAPLLVQARVHGEGGEVLDLALILAQFSDLDARSDSASHGWSMRADYLRARSKAQAKALEGMIRAQLKAQPRQPLVLLADTDALPASLGLADLTAARYSVVRDGQAEAVDRILVNQRLLESAFGARVEFARINADFGEDNSGDAGVPVRSSDHDPQVLFLRLH